MKVNTKTKKLKKQKNSPLESKDPTSGNGGVVKPCPAPIISIPPEISPAATPNPNVQMAK